MPIYFIRFLPLFAALPRQITQICDLPRQILSAAKIEAIHTTLNGLLLATSTACALLLLTQRLNHAFGSYSSFPSYIVTATPSSSILYGTV